jgi:hypothetical protein
MDRTTVKQRVAVPGHLHAHSAVQVFMLRDIQYGVQQADCLGCARNPCPDSILSVIRAVFVKESSRIIRFDIPSDI